MLVHNANYGQIQKAIKAGGDAPGVSNSEEAIQAVKVGLKNEPGDEAKFIGYVEMKPDPNTGIPTPVYPDKKGASKWFAIHPAEPDVGNDLPHIKWHTPEKNGHVWISQDDYDAIVNCDEQILAILLEYFN